MANSYRIRTEVGVDKSVQVYLDQDFEYLEILSLKLLQSQIYTRQCADYGVVIGRVSINNGFGIPNAKVSIFIPLETNDEDNPAITSLYPYKTLSTRNDDGYRYNLLPYIQQHGGHTPTGTFFDREDVLIDTNLIEVYDKYYKYTARTNDSGDFMIFGVPLGTQTIHIDIDLSDIGEFSLTPQDLVRMGMATENQVAGTRFKSSNNLGELPQIISINRTIEVEPLWGQEDLCNIGITRSDFDLSDAMNIRIEPTAIFMGSLFSANENLAQKRNCSPRLKQGKLCSLVTGPGEILAIRQTIFQDVNGRPALQRYDVEEGGQVIDENGAWMIEVPMNLNYVTTNEFGQQVTSLNPNVGIPTRGKYRFKVKWNQAPTMREPIKRGYFLVPNIREYGWQSSYPNDDPLTSNSQNLSITDFRAAVTSYAFSLDWLEYGARDNSGLLTPLGEQMIEDAIKCEDKFYEFQYNKVYTVAELITQYRRGRGSNRIIAIKDILEDTCESDNHKFPTNDSNYRVDILYLFFTIFITLFKIVLIYLIIYGHIIAYYLFLAGFIIGLIVLVIGSLVVLICNFIQGLIDFLNGIYLPLGIGSIFNLNNIECPDLEDVGALVEKIINFYKYFTNLPLPLLTYPDCELCDCKIPSPPGIEIPSPNDPQTGGGSSTGGGGGFLTQTVLSGFLSQYTISSNYSNVSPVTVNGVTSNPILTQLMSGAGVVNPPSSLTRVPQSISYGQDVDQNKILAFTTSLTIAERINLFNVKAKYFDADPVNNPGGGVNQIKVTFNVDSNNTSTQYHLDNVLVMSCKASNLSFFTPGKIVSFQDPAISSDINLDGLGFNNQYGVPSSTGATLGTIVGGTSTYVYPLQYADPDGVTGNISVALGGYVITGSSTDALYHKFPIDIEYFQVLTATTYSNYNSLCSTSLTNSLNERFLNNNMTFYFINKDTSNNTISGKGAGYWWTFGSNSFVYKNPIQSFTNYGDEVIVFLVRGVDPYSTRNKNRYDLSKLFGYSSFGSGPIVEGNYKLNIPIQGKFKPADHDEFATDAFKPNDTYANIPLYYPSFHYSASTTGQGKFSSFTSNFPSYYSKLTNAINGTFSPNSPLPSLTLGSLTSNSLEGTKVLNGGSPNSQNGFSYEFVSSTIKFDCINVPYNSPPITTPGPFQNAYDVYEPLLNTVSSQNRGYFNGEVVDGGSLFYQSLNIDTANQNFNYCSTYAYPGYLYSPRYSTVVTYDPSSTNFNGTNIVMRADRLPTSTSTQEGANNSYLLQNNSNFTIYSIDDVGLVQSAQTIGGSGSLNTGGSDANDDIPSNPILDSFTCDNLIPLPCYDTDSTSGEPIIKPPGDDCYETALVPNITIGPFTIPIYNITIELIIGPKQRIVGGCYQLLTAIFFSLAYDIIMIFEWATRMQINFAACRNVWSHLFTNNWVNGTLYAFPINNDRFYTAPNASEPNKGFSLYCNDTMYLDDKNNYYYRCSPFVSDLTTGSGEFIGQPAPKPPFIGSTYGGNDRNLMFPVTVVDLGPKNTFIQELVMSSEYDGYVIDKLNQTSFQDVEETLNTLIISRLTDRAGTLGGFLNQVIGIGGGANALSFFNRRGKFMVDGDYAQSISVSSEIGVATLQSENYPANPAPGALDPVYFNWGGGQDRIFGIFYTGDTQIRDWISPKRTIIVPSANTTTSSICAFSNYGVFSQEVPFYQWHDKDNLDTNNSGGLRNTIFGSQRNDWFTSGVIPSQNFFKFRYQSMDRLNPNCRYFRPSNNTSQSFFKGYIYTVSPGATFANVDLSAQRNHWDFNNVNTDVITVGAPFHFYFGLKRGATAWDKFAEKYLDFENIENV